jgi:hypothetical protein
MLKTMAVQGDEGRRRGGERVPVDLPAMIGGRSPREARLVDLSTLGCLLRSEAPLSLGAVVDLRVEMPYGLLRAKARVAESSIDGESLPAARQRHLVGLEFLGLAAVDEVQLRSFVDAQRRRGAHTPPA